MPCPTNMPDTLCALMPQMSRLARRLTGNGDQAQDLCQEVFLKLWARLKAGHEIKDLRAYAMIAMRNQYRQWLRDLPPFTPMQEQDEPATSDVSATLAVQEVGLAIAELPAPQARLMRLVAAGETSPKSLAQVTGWPVGTVMSRLARARAKLRVKVGLGRNRSTVDLL